MVGDDHFSEDDIVEEIEVFLSKKMIDQLFLIQYPLKPEEMDRGSSQVEVKIKHDQMKVEMKIGLEADSNVYDNQKAQQIAYNCSGTVSERLYPLGRMDGIMFANGPTAGLHKLSYAAAFYKDGRLHLNPIREIVQLKPTFPHLTTEAAAQRKDEKGDSSLSEGEGEPVSAVTVRFARGETDAAKKRRESSYQYQNKMKEEEPWSTLEYHDQEADESYLQRDLLVCAPSTSSAIYNDSLSLEADTVFRALAPKSEELDQSTPSLPSDTISLSHLRTLPLQDQISNLMMKVQVIRFTQLMTLLSTQADESIVLTIVQQFAVLVRGCWVVKSEVLYAKDSTSVKTEAGTDLLCKARDFALYRFTQKPAITRKDVADFIKIPSEDLADIMHGIARFFRQKGWEFMYPTDSDFLERHPDIVEKQNALWSSVINHLKQFIDQIGRQRLDSGSGKNTSRARRRTGSKSGSPDQDFPDGILGGRQRVHSTSRTRTLSGQRQRNSSSVSMKSPPRARRRTASTKSQSSDNEHPLLDLHGASSILMRQNSLNNLSDSACQSPPAVTDRSGLKPPPGLSLSPLRINRNTAVLVNCDYSDKKPSLMNGITKVSPTAQSLNNNVDIITNTTRDVLNNSDLVCNGENLPSSLNQPMEVDDSHSNLRKALTRFLSERFCVKPLLTMTEIQRLLMIEVEELPPDHVLCEGGVTKDLVEDVAVNELQAKRLPASLCQKPTYILASTGNHQKVRHIIVRLLMEKHKFKFPVLKTACAMEIDDGLPADFELKNILNEYCVIVEDFYTVNDS